MRFAYRAIDADGRRVRGQIDAAGLADLEARLGRLGLDLVSGAPFHTNSFSLGLGLGPDRLLPRRELIDLCFHLEQLYRAGVPLQDGLTDLRDTLDRPRSRRAAAALAEAVAGGQSLSQTMAAQGRTFPPLAVNLVRAGEASGRLAEVLASLGDTLKWEDELAAHTRRALTYPAFVAVVVLAATGFLMVYLVPQLKQFVRGMGQALPLQTRALFAVSDLLARHWPTLLLLPPLLLALGTALWRTSPRLRLATDGALLRLPLIGGLLLKLALSRFAATFALLYGAGIPVLEGLGITRQVVGNRAVRQTLARAETQIAQGSGIAAAFAHTGLFPPLVLRMLRIGEQTGGLDRTLANVGYFYTRDVRDGAARLQSLVEPALTLILGALLGWVMLAVLGPVYDTLGRIKA